MLKYSVYFSGCALMALIHHWLEIDMGVTALFMHLYLIIWKDEK